MKSGLYVSHFSTFFLLQSYQTNEDMIHIRNSSNFILTSSNLSDKLILSVYSLVEEINFWFLHKKVNILHMLTYFLENSLNCKSVPFSEFCCSRYYFNSMVHTRCTNETEREDSTWKIYYKWNNNHPRNIQNQEYDLKCGRLYLKTFCHWKKIKKLFFVIFHASFCLGIWWLKEREEAFTVI